MRVETDILVEAAEMLDFVLNDKGTTTTGFVLMVYPLGDETGICQYISNSAKREQVIRMARQLIVDLGQPEIRGSA